MTDTRMENSRPVSAAPLVSVILLSYNQEDSVGAAIESVLAQDCPFPFELIIGDDASADSTRAVCERYAAARPDVVRLMPAAPNKGVVRNYFDCFSHCRGRYVTDCAGDDRWSDPSKLRAMAALLEADPSVNVVFSGKSSTRRQGTAHAAPTPLIFLRLAMPAVMMPLSVSAAVGFCA